MDGVEVIDLSDIVHGILGPVCDQKAASYTLFSLSEEETAEHIVQNLLKECPGLTGDRMQFSRNMMLLYDKMRGD